MHKRVKTVTRNARGDSIAASDVSCQRIKVSCNKSSASAALPAGDKQPQTEAFGADRTHLNARSRLIRRNCLGYSRLEHLLRFPPGRRLSRDRAPHALGFTHSKLRFRNLSFCRRNREMALSAHTPL